MTIFRQAGFRLLRWFVIKLFPDWYYRQTWRWGNTEATVKQQLLESNKTGSIQLYRDFISEAHEIILIFLNKNHSGFYLEESIGKELSIRDFKQLYVIVITLFAVCLQVSKADKFFDDILILFPGGVSLTQKLIQGLEIRDGDQKKQALFAWNCILDIIGEDRNITSGLWSGSFVIFTENMLKRLRSRWK